MAFLLRSGKHFPDEEVTDKEKVNGLSKQRMLMRSIFFSSGPCHFFRWRYTKTNRNQIGVIVLCFYVS